jgi:phosphopantetheinyl transferase (holo-ACP synthase)
VNADDARGALAAALDDRAGSTAVGGAWIAVVRSVDGTGRAAERSAGRTAAAAALAALGLVDTEVTADEGGRPIWPDGAAGSIAHTDRVAVAVVALVGPGEPPLAVGVDVEQVAALAAADAAVVLRPAEQEAVSRAGRPDELATVLWCAKEAVYKAWSARRGDALDPVEPRDIEVTVVGGELTIEAHGSLVDVVGPAPVLGWWTEAGGHVVVVVRTG